MHYNLFTNLQSLYVSVHNYETIQSNYPLLPSVLQMKISQERESPFNNQHGDKTLEQGERGEGQGLQPELTGKHHPD